MSIRNVVFTGLVALGLGALLQPTMASALSQLSSTICNTAGAPCIAVYNTATGQGLYGSSAHGDALEGVTTSGTAVYAKSLTSIGLSNAVFGLTNSHGAGVYGESDGLWGSAFYAAAPNGSDLFNSIGGAPSFGSFWVDNAANIHTTGMIYTAGGCSAGCTRHRLQQAYGMTASLPSIEDSGEAQLSLGSVYVRLRPDFSNAIDPGKGYVVFITPEGDTRGLFVTGRSALGFFVRETMGGRSSIPFAYRIVGHPFGVRVPRMPFVAR